MSEQLYIKNLLLRFKSLQSQLTDQKILNLICGFIISDGFDVQRKMVMAMNEQQKQASQTEELLKNSKSQQKEIEQLSSELLKYQKFELDFGRAKLESISEVQQQNNKLQAENRDKQNEIDRLTKELKQALLKQNDSDNVFANLNREMHNIKEGLIKNLSADECTKSLLLKANNRIKDLEIELIKSNNKIKVLTRQSDNCLLQSTKNIEGIQRLLDEEQQKVLNLQEKIEQQNKEIQQSVRALNNSQQQLIQAGMLPADSKPFTAQSLQAACIAASSAVTQQQATIDTQQKQITSLNDQVAQNKLITEQVKQQLEQASAQLKEHVKQEQALTQQRDDLKLAVDATTRKVEEQAQEAERINKQLVEKQAEVQASNAQVQQFQAQAQQLAQLLGVDPAQDTAMQLQSAIASVQRIKSECESGAAQAVADKERYEAELTTVKEQLQAKQAEVQQAVIDKQSQDNHIQDLTNKLLNDQKQITQHEQQLKKLCDVIGLNDPDDIQLPLVIHKIKDMRQNMQEKDNQVEATQAEIKSLKEQLLELQQQLQESNQKNYESLSLSIEKLATSKVNSLDQSLQDLPHLPPKSGVATNETKEPDDPLKSIQTVDISGSLLTQIFGIKQQQDGDDAELQLPEFTMEQKAAAFDKLQQFLKIKNPEDTVSALKECVKMQIQNHRMVRQLYKSFLGQNKDINQYLMQFTPNENKTDEQKQVKIKQIMFYANVRRLFTCSFPSAEQLASRRDNVMAQLVREGIVKKSFYQSFKTLYNFITMVLLSENNLRVFNLEYDHGQNINKYQIQYSIKNYFRCYYNYSFERYYQLLFTNEMTKLTNICMIQIGHSHIDMFLELMIVILCMVLDNYYWDEKQSEARNESATNLLFIDTYIQLDPQRKPVGRLNSIFQKDIDAQEGN